MANEAKLPLPDPWQGWFDDYGWKLMAFARQLVQAPADAEDLVQEIVLEFWRLRPAQPPELPMALFKLRQRAIDLSRRRLSQLRRETQWRQEQQEHLGWATNDLRSANTKVLVQPSEIQRIVSRLEPIFREVIVLKLWNELTMRQIAVVLGISPNTAASRYRLAIQKLRAHLNEMCHE